MAGRIVHGEPGEKRELKRVSSEGEREIERLFDLNRLVKPALTVVSRNHDRKLKQISILPNALLSFVTESPLNYCVLGQFVPVVDCLVISLFFYVSLADSRS